MSEAPKPKAPAKAPIVKTERKKSTFVPTDHLTVRPFRDLDLKMYGQAAKKGNRK